MSQEEDEYWAKKLTDVRHTQLETVQKAATGWATLFTAVLGVVGSVTFVTGLNGLNDLTQPIQWIVKGGITAAAVIALAATILAGVAANSMPKVSDDVTFDNFRTKSKTKALAALGYLRVALILGAAAAIIVVAGSLLVLFSDKATTPAQPQSVIVEVHGKVYCGTPAVSPDGAMSIGSVPLDGARSITVVNACPAKP